MKLSRPASPRATSRLAHYRERFPDVEGWFLDEAQAVWDFLLTSQAAMSIHGGFMEIGVWRGKSALLGALHMREDEPVVLVDINEMQDVADAIRSFHSGEVVAVRTRSSVFRTTKHFDVYRGRIRFFHVDGEHSGHGTYSDVRLAAEMAGERALIVIDDFGNMRYPQLHAGLYRFLFERPDFRMVLCGGNKAYLCRAEDFALFDDLIRSALVKHARNVGVEISLARTSYAHDFGCFSVQSGGDGPSLVGRDEDPTRIVF